MITILNGLVTNLKEQQTLCYLQRSNLHGAEQFAILIVTLVFADQKVQFVYELTFHQAEGSTRDLREKKEEK